MFHGKYDRAQTCSRGWVGARCIWTAQLISGKNIIFSNSLQIPGFAAARVHYFSVLLSPSYVTNYPTDPPKRSRAKTKKFIALIFHLLQVQVISSMLFIYKLRSNEKTNHSSAWRSSLSLTHSLWFMPFNLNLISNVSNSLITELLGFSVDCVYF